MLLWPCFEFDKVTNVAAVRREDTVGYKNLLRGKKSPSDTYICLARKVRRIRTSIEHHRPQHHTIHRSTSHNTSLPSVSWLVTSSSPNGSLFTDRSLRHGLCRTWANDILKNENAVTIYAPRSAAPPSFVSPHSSAKNSTSGTPNKIKVALPNFRSSQ